MAALLVLGPLLLFGGVALAVYGVLIMRKAPIQNAIVSCPDCGRKLRLPASNGRFKVTCPACRHSFFHGA